MALFLLHSTIIHITSSSTYTSSLPVSSLTPYISSLPAQSYPTPQDYRISSYSSVPAEGSPAPQGHPVTSYAPLPDCSEQYSTEYQPISSNLCGTYAQNCTVVVESQYTIQYKEECGRRYQKVCQGGAQSNCKAVIDPGCYQVPTHTPVDVPREVCYNPTGEKCDRYPRRAQTSVLHQHCK